MDRVVEKKGGNRTTVRKLGRRRCARKGIWILFFAPLMSRLVSFAVAKRPTPTSEEDRKERKYDERYGRCSGWWVCGVVGGCVARAARFRGESPHRQVGFCGGGRILNVRHRLRTVKLYDGSSGTPSG